MDELIAKRYGTALFEVARDHQAMDRMETDIRLVLNTIQENPDFIEILLLPSVLLEKKKGLIKEAFAGKINQDLMSLLLLTADKARQGHLEGILGYALQAIQEEKGVLTAYVTSAADLTAEEREELQDKLSKQTGKKIELDCKIDAALIGGMVIRVKDRLLDYTIRGELHKLVKQLNAVKISD